MIKEVEINPTIQSIKTGYLYPPIVADAAVQMLTGYLTDDGKLLTVEINREVASKSIRLVHLWFAAVDSSTKQVEYTLLETKNPVVESSEPDNSVLPIPSSIHYFDISDVLSIPRRISQIPNVGEVSIEIFTYEANITSSDGTAIYGQKRLSVPYSSTLNTDITLPSSTDGWYPLGVVDYAVRDINESYTTKIKQGDIVWWYEGAGDGGAPTIGELKTGVLYVAQEDTEMNTEVEGKWVLATEADILRFTSLPFAPSVGSATCVVGADVFITRHVKYVMIKDMLNRVTYRPYNDKSASKKLSFLTAMREQIISHLKDGDQIRAYMMYQKLVNEYDSYINAPKSQEYAKVTSKYTL